jgi:hypothetical protein
MTILSVVENPWAEWPKESFGVVCFVEKCWTEGANNVHRRELRGAVLKAGVKGLGFSAHLDTSGLPDFLKTAGESPEALYSEAALYLYSEGFVTLFDPSDPDEAAVVAELLSSLSLGKDVLSVRAGNTLHGPWAISLDGEGFCRAVVCVTPRPDVARGLTPESYRRVMDHLLTFYDMAGIPALP